uniref:Uncharacterized protein n=1 Tax=Glossina morsitans morsitans TaxID=37546 RepID=A0A1B0FP27_GLOMM
MDLRHLESADRFHILMPLRQPLKYHKTMIKIYYSGLGIYITVSEGINDEPKYMADAWLASKQAALCFNCVLNCNHLN